MSLPFVFWALCRALVKGLVILVVWRARYTLISFFLPSSICKCSVVSSTRPSISITIPERFIALLFNMKISAFMMFGSTKRKTSVEDPPPPYKNDLEPKKVRILHLCMIHVFKSPRTRYTLKVLAFPLSLDQDSIIPGFDVSILTYRKRCQTKNAILERVG